MNDLIVRGKMELSTEDSAKLIEYVENCNRRMEENDEKMAIMAISIESMSQKIDDLVKQLHWAVPLSAPQARKVNEYIRKRAEELLKKYGYTVSTSSVKRVGNAIRKGVCAPYGVRTVREIPKCEFITACTMAQRWFDINSYKKAVEGIEKSI